MNGLPDTGNPLEDAKELGRGLMRGNKDELKLGYDWKNALLACLGQYEITDEEDRLRLAVYLRGFGSGLNVGPENDDDFHREYASGFRTGMDEAISGTLYPASLERSERQVKRHE